MRRILAVAVFLLAPFAALAQEPQLAPEGRGLLPAPSPAPTILQGETAPQTFAADASGTFARTVFEADGPDFHLVIRDFSIPPDRQTHALTLPQAAVLQMLSDTAEITIANRPRPEPAPTAAPAARLFASVSAGARVDLTNRGEGAAVVRAYILEAKQP